jgi:ABC-2 type transport system ATP-binding protein
VPVVAVHDLVKTYPGRRAVDGVSFAIERGEVYGLLGENGAGKTTTVEILEGHRVATSGSISVLGNDPAGANRDFRDRIGIVLQTSAVEPKLSVREALTLYGRCYRRPRPVEECVTLVGLAEHADQRIERLSGGLKRRLDLALGIVGHPELLFLDEPTTGFDPAARRGSWELIRALCSGGTTVLLTSHYLDEVEQLADRVGVLRAGRLVAEGTPDELAASSGDTTIRFRLPAGVDRGELATVLDGAVPAGQTPDDVVFTTTAPTLALHRLTSWAVARGVELDDLAVNRPSLEDLFLALTAEPDGESVDA